MYRIRAGIAFMLLVMATIAGAQMGPPNVPQNLAATPGDTTVDLQWQASAQPPGVLEYHVLRSQTVFARPVEPPDSAMLGSD